MKRSMLLVGVLGAAGLLAACNPSGVDLTVRRRALLEEGRIVETVTLRGDIACLEAGAVELTPYITQNGDEAYYSTATVACDVNDTWRDSFVTYDNLTAGDAHLSLEVCSDDGCTTVERDITLERP